MGKHKTIKLTKGKTAIVDAEMFGLVNRYKWTASKSAHDYYAIRRVTVDGKRKIVYMHRFIMNCTNGKQVHHINQNTLDNRRENLEVVTQQENLSYRYNRNGKGQQYEQGGRNLKRDYS